MQPPSFAHRREAECLAIAMAINPGLAANPILLPSLAKYTDHPQSSCLLFLFLPLFLSLLSNLCTSTHEMMLSVHPGYRLQVLLFSPLSIPQERSSCYTAGLGACRLLLHVHLLHLELQEGLPHSCISFWRLNSISWGWMWPLFPQNCSSVSSSSYLGSLSHPRYCSYTLPSPKFSVQIPLNLH